MTDNDDESRQPSFIFQSPDSDRNLKRILIDAFESDSEYDQLRILAATISEQGVDGIEPHLSDFVDSGGELDVYIGLSMAPDPAGIRSLMYIQEDSPGLVSVKLIENGTDTNLFHPKIYCFNSNSEYHIIIGSPNWSHPGLEKNIEAMAVIDERISDPSESSFIDQVESAFRELRELNSSEETWGRLRKPTEDILRQLDRVDGTMTELERSPTRLEFEDGGVEDVDSLWPLSRTSPEIVMELHRESRMSQIVPPNVIWDQFFDVDPRLFSEDNPTLPRFELHNVATGENIEMPVVDHDHQGTIEIPEARNRDDPSKQRAFLIFRRKGERSFDYELFLEGEHEEAEDIGDFLSDHGYEPGSSSRLTYVTGVE